MYYGPVTVLPLASLRLSASVSVDYKHVRVSDHELQQIVSWMHYNATSVYYDDWRNAQRATMFALPKLSAWIPARVTHHLVRRALSLVFVLPPDLAIASDLEAGSLVLQDLVLDVGVSDGILYYGLAQGL